VWELEGREQEREERFCIVRVGPRVSEQVCQRRSSETEIDGESGVSVGVNPELRQTHVVYSRW
jgi:hypothetical protein